MPRTANLPANSAAFLDMIAWSEGTAGTPTSDDGYNVLVGSTHAHPLLFDDYADHPNVLNKEFDSTAAGRYQVLHRWWVQYKAQLGLPDFSPESQDAVALRQIVESGALDFIYAGKFQDAVSKCAHIWASLPGAGYGQREQRLADLQNIYLNAGGTLAQS